MSDIPKSKRAYSNLEAHHKALEIRRKIAVELLASFAYSEKKLEAAIKKQTAHIQDPEHKKDVAEATRSLENDYACWFIKRHRDRVDDLACLIGHTSLAGALDPTPAGAEAAARALAWWREASHPDALAPRIAALMLSLIPVLPATSVPAVLDQAEAWMTQPSH